MVPQSARPEGASAGVWNICVSRFRAMEIFWYCDQIPSARRMGWTERPASKVQAASPPTLKPPSITTMAPAEATETIVRFEKNHPVPWARLPTNVTK